MATGNIKSRQSIHRQTPESTVTKISTDYEFQEHSDGYESNHENTTQDLEESQESSHREIFELQNRSEVNVISRRSLNASGKDVRTSSLQRKSSFLDKQSNSVRLESAVVDKPQRYGNIISLMIFIIPIICMMALVFRASTNSHGEKRMCSFSKLKEKYPKEGDYLWDHLQIGNEIILNNESDKPAVFLFVHHGKPIVEELINEIASTSADCYGSKTTIHKDIGLTSKEAIQDYGHVIDTYKKSIQEGHVIFIANLNEIPGEAAKALHSICDTVTPLVKKVIILLSLTVEQKNVEEKVIDSAENAMRQLWQDKIKPNELEPIITRVTDQVLLLQSN